MSITGCLEHVDSVGNLAVSVEMDAAHLSETVPFETTELQCVCGLLISILFYLAEPVSARLDDQFS